MENPKYVIRDDILEEARKYEATILEGTTDKGEKVVLILVAGEKNIRKLKAVASYTFPGLRDVHKELETP